MHFFEKSFESTSLNLLKIGFSPISVGIELPNNVQNYNRSKFKYKGIKPENFKNTIRYKINLLGKLRFQNKNYFFVRRNC